jgi:hypothetical protein
MSDNQNQPESLSLRERVSMRESGESPQRPVKVVDIRPKLDSEKTTEELQREVLLMQKDQLEREARREPLFKTIFKALMAFTGVWIAIGVVLGVIMFLVNDYREKETATEWGDYQLQRSLDRYSSFGSDSYIESLPMKS